MILDAYPHIKCINLEHLFWNKYPYQVSLIVYSLDLSPKERMQKSKDFFKNLKIIGEHTYRNSKNLLKVYFLDEQSTLNFISEYQHIIQSVIRPEKLSHIDFLLENVNYIKILLRDTLFWNEYPWRIHFNENDFVYDWLKNFSSHTDCFISHDVGYFFSKDDVMSIKLALGEHIKKIENIILRSSLDC